MSKKEKREKYFDVRALKTSQGKETEVFSFFAPGNSIRKIADISRIQRDESDRLDGFQRREIKAHVKNIIDYLDQENVIFPNAIILALSPGYQFAKSRGTTPKGSGESVAAGVLNIPLRPEGSRIAWIVDGQQRSLALSETKNSDILVPVVAFTAKDLDTQREQFVLVNKAKPLPTGLINELLPEIGSLLPRDLTVRKIPSELCNQLNRDPKSPFHKMIKRASDKTDAPSLVSDTALINVMKNSIGNPSGALAPYKGSGPNDPPKIDEMYKLLCLFWQEVSVAFPDAWGLPPQRSRLMHSAGIQAMGYLMDRLMLRAQAAANPRKSVRDSLKGIAPRCHWRSGRWEHLDLGWDQIQNVPKHVKGLADLLVRLDNEAISKTA
jgi:DGQHR domain-containing protein